MSKNKSKESIVEMYGIAMPTEPKLWTRWQDISVNPAPKSVLCEWCYVEWGRERQADVMVHEGHWRWSRSGKCYKWEENNDPWCNECLQGDDHE
jgi:hypothetical protein